MHYEQELSLLMKTGIHKELLLQITRVDINSVFCLDERVMASARRNSYFGRVIGSFAAAVFGIGLFVGSFVLLGWNEKDATRQKAAIAELEDVAIADVSAQTINPDYDGKLIHTAYEAISQDVLEFKEFGIKENAIRVFWEAEIYQWVESSKTENDRRVYSYSKKWVDRVQDSSSFNSGGQEGGRHSNYGSNKKFSGGNIFASNVMFGAFKLPPSLIKKIKGEQKYNIDSGLVSDLYPGGSVSDGVFYSNNPTSPQIGDERVKVFIVPPKKEVTIMARQSGQSFLPYQTENNISKELLYMGKKSKEEVIDAQRFEAALKRWGFRGGGFLAMWLGLVMILKPLRAIVSFIPFAGRMLEGAVAFVTFFLAMALSLFTIGVSWIFVRPGFAGFILLAAIISIVLVYRAKGNSQLTS